MMLDPYREHLLLFATGQMTSAEEAAFLQAQAAHGKDAAELAAEAEALRTLWDDLGHLPDPEPSPTLRARFYTHLNDELAAQQRPSLVQRMNTWLNHWWPRQPAVQLGLAVVLLLVGYGLGTAIQPADAPPDDVALLRDEVGELRQMMAVSLLQQASAAERLRGITWSYRIAQPDSAVVTALMNTLNYDPNVNVRLAAVDAFQAMAPKLAIDEALVTSLRRQQSPLVQLALIDLVVALQAEEARDVLHDLVRDDALPPEVRTRAEAGIREL